MVIRKFMRYKFIFMRILVDLKWKADLTSQKLMDFLAPFFMRKGNEKKNLF